MTINTKEQRLAIELFSKTHTCFLLTGEAGTGKTTLVKYFQEMGLKNILVVAPTGAAAIQAGGQTIHKTFGFPLEVIGPKTFLKITSDRRELLRHADTIVVDECSMVRADLLDGMDRVLRIIMTCNLPFGGKQVILVGDPYQLPPVVNGNMAEKMLLEDMYGEGVPYFYKANVFKRINFPKIQLEKIYRQTDLDFIRALNDIRKGKVETEDFDLLNKRVQPECDSEDYGITVTALNRTADSINEKHLAELDTPEFCYSGEFKGDFNIKSVNVPEELHLKVGAQVLFCRNDKCGRYINGTIAKVIELGEDEIKVALSDGTEISVEKTVWEEKKSEYDRESKTITSKVVGQFLQYPLKLAWAITIHKSQGMTFDKMRLDLTTGVFEPGQIYVALSRVRSLDGLSLSTKLQPYHVIQNPEINAFASSFNDERMIEEVLSTNKDIDKYVAEDDYNTAVLNCMYHIKKRLANRDFRGAALLAKKMFDLMLSDQVLLGSTKDVTLLKESGMTANFLNSIICLYQGLYDEAVAFADRVLAQRMCREAMFIKCRALTLLKRYEEADELNVKFYQDETKEGDGIIDKKWLYNIVVVNSCKGDPVIPFAQQVLKICPKSLEAIRCFRQEMLGHGWHIEPVGVDKFDQFLSDFNKKEVSLEKISEMVTAMRTDTPEVYMEFVDLLKEQNWT